MKRTVVVFVLLGLGVLLLWRTRALLYLAVAVLVGRSPYQAIFHGAAVCA